MRFFPYVLTILLVAPGLVLAAPGSFRDLVDRIVVMVDLIIPVLISLGVLFFMYNIVGSFGIFSGEKDAFSQERFRTAFFWGLIILFVMVSLWGILRILQSTIDSADTSGFNSGSPAFVCNELDGIGCE